MKRSRFSEEQIVGFIREAEAGIATADLCRRHGFSAQTFNRWKAKYGGMEVSQVRELKCLEEENRQLKQCVAEMLLGNKAIQAAPSRGCHERSGAERTQGLRGGAHHARDGIATDLGRVRTVRCASGLRELAHKHRRFGYRRLTVLLRREGQGCNAKRVYRLYRNQ